MSKKYFLAMFILLILFASACSQQATVQQNAAPAANAEKTAEKIVEPVKEASPALKIISPSDGELIKNSNVTVKLQAENFRLVPIGQPIKNGEGHIHVWLDSEKKLGPQTEFTFENIASGRHSIVAELVKSNHSSLTPKITKIITINVESDYVPKVQSQNANEFSVDVDDNGFYPGKIQAKAGDEIKIIFKFKDESIYFAGLDIKGPFPTLSYKLHGQQPLTASFKVDGPSRIDSYWPSTGVHKATLYVEIMK